MSDTQVVIIPGMGRLVVSSRYISDAEEYRIVVTKGDTNLASSGTDEPIYDEVVAALKLLKTVVETLPDKARDVITQILEIDE